MCYNKRVGTANVNAERLSSAIGRKTDRKYGNTIALVSCLFLLSSVVFSSMVSAANGVLDNDTPDSSQTLGGFNANDYWKWTAYSGYFTAVASEPPTGFDYDIYLYEGFDGNDGVVPIGGSDRSGDVIDAYVINGHELAGNTQYYAKIYAFTGVWGANPYTVEADSQGTINGPLKVDTLGGGTFSMGVNELIEVHDVYLYKDGDYTINLTSYPGGANYNIYLYDGNGNLESYRATGNQSTQIAYTPPITGWHGIMITDESDTSGGYEILVSGDYATSINPSRYLVGINGTAAYMVTIDNKGKMEDINVTIEWDASSPGGIPTNVAVSLENATLPYTYTPEYPVETVGLALEIRVDDGGSTTDGEYWFNVTFDDTGDIDDDTAITGVVLIKSSDPNFMLIASPTNQIVSQGEIASYDIMISTINEFDEPLDFNATVVSGPTPNYINFTWSPDPPGATGVNSTAEAPQTTLTTVTNSGGTTPTGTYTIFINATNGTVVRNVTVDLTVNPPGECEIIQPADGDRISGVYTFQVGASSAIGIDKVELTFAGVLSSLGSRNAPYNPGTGYYELSVDTAKYNDGAASMSAVATDAGGGKMSDSVSFTVDNTGPNPQITNPSDGSYVNGTVEVRVTTDNTVVRVEYRIDDNAWTVMDGGPTKWTSTWNTANTTDGDHTLTARAKDDLSLLSTTSITIHVDNNNPSVNVVAPINGQYIEGLYTFKVSASDANGVTGVTVNIGGGGAQPMIYSTASGYWEYEYDTAVLTSGTLYSLEAIATDASGKTTTTSLTSGFYPDNDRPIPTIVDPLDGDYEYGTAAILQVTTADLTLTRLEYRIDDGAWVDIPNLSDTTWDTTTYTDGAHTITVRATDAIGHMETSSVGIYVDNHDPVCVIITPVENQFVEGAVVFRVSASDDVRIDRVTLTILDTTIDNITIAFNSQSGYFEYSLLSVTVSDGAYTVLAWAHDGAGRTTMASPIRFSVDNNAPTLAIDQPDDNAYVSGTYTIQVNSADVFISTVEYRIDATGWMSMTGPQPVWTASWDTSSFADGQHTITVRAIDEAGHVTQQSIVVTVDNNNPVCSIIAPIDDQYVEGTFSFKVAASDTVEISQVDLIVFGFTVITAYNGNTGYYEYTVDTTTKVDGQFTAIATAYDTAGNSVSSGTVNFNVDNNAPALAIDQPTSGAFVSGDFVITVTSTDTFLSTVEYKIDASGWSAMIGPQPTWTAVWSTTNFVDGEHTLTVRAKDDAGHVMQNSIAVIIDNNAPTTRILSPLGNETVAGFLTIVVLAEDAISVDYVTINLFGSTDLAVFSSNSGYYEYTVSTIGRDGLQTVTATAVDMIGNSATSSGVSFKVDNTPPSIDLALPSDNKGLIVFAATVSDESAVDKVYINIDGKGWEEMIPVAPMTYEYVWGTTTRDNGVHSFIVKAVDSLGNEATESSTVSVDNPSDDWQAFLGLIPLMVFLFIVVVVVLFIFLLRRGTIGRWWRGESKPRTSEEEEIEEESDTEEERA